MADTERCLAWLEAPSGVPMPIGDRLSLGRADENGLVLQSPKISRHHASIHRQGSSEFWIADMGSQNGTYVNGAPLTRPQPLHDGDRIGLGDDSFLFRQRGGTAQTPVPDDPQHTAVDIRQLTCWFLVADIEGYSAMSRSMEPAWLGRMVGSWIAACRAAVEGEGGTLNKFLGDGFFAYWPSRDGSAEKVARAALGLRALQDSAPNFRFILHQGIATFSGQLSGEVVIGPEVNFAFRMEKVAKDLGVPRLLSQQAAERLPPPIATRPAGRCAVAGFSGLWDFHTFD